MTLIPNGSTVPDYSVLFDSDQTQDRSTSLIHLPTRSSLSRPVVYTTPDQCGRDVYDNYSASVTVNDLIDCSIVQAASLSMSITTALPLDDAQSKVFQALATLGYGVFYGQTNFPS